MSNVCEKFIKYFYEYIEIFYPKDVKGNNYKLLQLIAENYLDVMIILLLTIELKLYYILILEFQVMASFL